jgi:hypothetical protein
VKRLSAVGLMAIMSACAGDSSGDALPPGTNVTPDSLRAAFHAYYGAAPTRFAQCGPRHLFFAFLDAPGDVLEQAKNTPKGRVFYTNALIDLGRGGLAEELASIAAAALPADAPIDTITVQLDRSTGSVTQFHLALDRNLGSPGNIAVRQIATGLDRCTPR